MDSIIIRNEDGSINLDESSKALKALARAEKKGSPSDLEERIATAYEELKANDPKGYVSNGAIVWVVMRNLDPKPNDAAKLMRHVEKAVSSYIMSTSSIQDAGQ